MAKLDVYLRSIERFGATGAILSSGQPVTLRFPTGDRQATQVTPHDQVVQLVREVAPPNVLDQIDKSRPGKFDFYSNGRVYAVSVAPKQGGIWQVFIDVVDGNAAPPEPHPASRTALATPPSGSPSLRSPNSGSAPSINRTPPAGMPAVARTVTPPRAGTSAGDEMAIERGQYDGGSPTAAAIAPSGGASGALLLDQLTRAARQARATDVYLMSGVQPVQRVNDQLVSTGAARIDGEQLSREIGLIAPNDARSQWTADGAAVFTYGDGLGRVRVTLGRDHRGPSAALRLLPDEPPPLESLGIPEVEGWLDRKGLIVVAGSSGSGKTVTLASLVRTLGERKRRVVSIEDPIELVHASPWISQRAVGPHVVSVSAGVAAAMNEGADAIVVGRVSSEATARGVVEAVAGGHLVLTTVVAPLAAVALDRMLAHLDEHQRELAHGLMFGSLLGAIQPVLGRNGSRSFEIIGRPTVNPSKSAG